jgi:RNA polymerase sigma factor (sigma-70 family)
MDTHLLDAVGAGATRRIVYVADTSCYGATNGTRPITEDAPLRPSMGKPLTPALDRLDGTHGRPPITRVPGSDGNAWFRERVIEPVMAGRRVLLFGKTGPWLSPIHVEDCARALVHLAERDEPSGRYFLVNHDPIRLDEFAGTFARLANRPLRVFRVPAVATRLVVGPVLADHLQADAVFSNIRLRGIGFRFLYPTLEQGLQQISAPSLSRGPDESFDAVVLPHLDAAYRLARWLMRDGHDADDVVQEASLRAFRYFRTFVGGDGRAWFLRIVRNTCYGWRRHGLRAPTDSFDEEQHSSARPQLDPEALLLQTDDATAIARAMSHLPDRFHQLLVLRGSGTVYRELSDVVGIPVRTVMSRPLAPKRRCAHLRLIQKRTVLQRTE